MTTKKRKAAKKMIAVEPELMATTADPKILYDEISLLITRFKPPKDKEDLLREYIMEAFTAIEVYHYFDNLDLINMKNDKIAQSIRRANVIFSKALTELIGVPDFEDTWDLSKEKVEEIQSNIKMLTNCAKKIQPATPTKKNKGRKTREDWSTIIPPLATAYLEVFGKNPTISNNYNNLDKRGEFAAFLDATIKVITGEDAKLKPMTLRNYLIKGRAKNLA